MNVILEGKPRTLVISQADKLRVTEVALRYYAHADQHIDHAKLLASCDAAVDVHFKGTLVDMDSDLDWSKLHVVPLDAVRNESNQVCLLCSIDSYYKENIEHELTSSLAEWSHLITPLLHELNCEKRYEAILIRADGSVQGMAGYSDVDIGKIAIVDPNFADIELPDFKKVIMPITGGDAATLLHVVGKATITYNRCFYRGD